MKKIFLLSFLFLSAVAYSQQSQPTVSVTGEGIVSVVPDKVLIKARVEHTGPSVKEVKALNDEVVSQVLSYLKSQGIPSENFQTEYINLNKEYNYESKESFYSANQAISILLEDLDKYEEVMSGLLNSGLNRIDGVQFKTSQKEALESQARKEAILDAKRKAQEYAQALNQEIGKAQMINELNSGDFQPVYRMEMKAADSNAAGQTLAPGEMEVSVKVNATFLLL